MKRAVLVLFCLSLTGCVITVHQRTTVTASATPVTFETATDAEKKGDLEQARLAYDRLLASTPNDPSTLARRASVLVLLGDRVAANRDIERAIQHSNGADRAYFLRHGGDLEPKLRGLRYMQSLEGNPFDIATHERVAAHLTDATDEGEITNYLRFLLEYKRTGRMADAAATLSANASPQELAAATGAALAQAADVVPPEELEATAAEFLERSPAGAEMRAVLDGRSNSWTWLSTNGNATAATNAPPHAAYRTLTHAVATGFAQRGELPRAERQHRLALEMPGADMSDVLELLEFLGSYGSLDALCTAVQTEEAKLARSAKLDQIAFRTGAMNAFALHGACTGEGTCNVAAQVKATYEIGGAPSDLARDLCPAAAAAPPACSMSIVVTHREPPGGLLNRSYGGTLFSVAIDDPDCALSEALDVLRADYRAEEMPPLVIEASAATLARARQVQNGLRERGIDATIVRGGDDQRVRVRFDVTSSR